MIKLKNYSLYKYKNKRIILHKKLIMTFYMTFLTLSKILKPENLQSSLYGQLFFVPKKKKYSLFALKFLGAAACFLVQFYIFENIFYIYDFFLFIFFVLLIIFYYIICIYFLLYFQVSHDDVLEKR